MINSLKCLLVSILAKADHARGRSLPPPAATVDSLACGPLTGARAVPEPGGAWAAGAGGLGGERARDFPLQRESERVSSGDTGRAQPGAARASDFILKRGRKLEDQVSDRGTGARKKLGSKGEASPSAGLRASQPAGGPPGRPELRRARTAGGFVWKRGRWVVRKAGKARKVSPSSRPQYPSKSAQRVHDGV